MSKYKGNFILASCLKSNIQAVQSRRKFRNTADRAQHSSQIVAVTADNGMSH
jgi:hypothetical protein